MVVNDDSGIDDRLENLSRNEGGTEAMLAR